MGTQWGGGGGADQFTTDWGEGGGGVEVSLWPFNSRAGGTAFSKQRPYIRETVHSALNL